MEVLLSPGQGRASWIPAAAWSLCAEPGSRRKNALGLVSPGYLLGLGQEPKDTEVAAPRTTCLTPSGTEAAAENSSLGLA